jgi:hypothetical protein
MEPGFKAPDVFQLNGQKIKEKGPVVFGRKGDQFTPLLGI